ncbi:unnamed protein product [Coffea canephora]|uniref:Uncharacterized protein n=1 Tax=Coffea canephora TaxID=49390 RepID=A0A068VA41_COFCA|nr:unnamed protein product [Coffea canephora]
MRTKVTLRSGFSGHFSAEYKRTLFLFLLLQKWLRPYFYLFIFLSTQECPDQFLSGPTNPLRLKYPAPQEHPGSM